MSDYLAEKCLHCHLFVESNEADHVEYDSAAYVHLTRGDEADELIEETHDAWPSGKVHTLSYWRVNGPEAMRDRFI